MSRQWVRLRRHGASSASQARVCFRPQRAKAGRPEAIEVFAEDPGMEDAFAVDANVVIAGNRPLTFVAVLYRRPDVDHAFFSRYWRETHARFGLLIPGAKSYIQMHAEAAPFDGICEVAFSSVSELRAGLQADVIAVDARADEGRFIDHSRSYGMICGRDDDRR